MTRHQYYTIKINQNTRRLFEIPPNTNEAKLLREINARLLIARMKMTIGEKLEVIDPVFTPEEMLEELENQL